MIYNKKSDLDHLHHIEWIEACKAGYKSKEYDKLTAPIEYSGPFTEIVLMGNLALRSYMIKDGKDFIGRKKLIWDGKNTRITNFDLAEISLRIGAAIQIFTRQTSTNYNSNFVTPYTLLGFL